MLWVQGCDLACPGCFNPGTHARGGEARSVASLTDALLALQAYRWPGNVRELKNMVESLLVSIPGDRIRLDDLPPTVRKSRSDPAGGGLTPGMTISEVERTSRATEPSIASSSMPRNTSTPAIVRPDQPHGPAKSGGRSA